MTTLNMALLATIVAATSAQPGFTVIAKNTDGLQPLIDAQYVETNDSVPNIPEHHTAARATNTGLQFSQNNGQGGFAAGFGSAQTQDNGQAQANVQTQDNGAQNGNGGGFQPAQTQTQAPTGTTGTAAPAATSTPVFERITGFAPSPKVAGEGVKRDQPEKYPFSELKAPVPNPANASGFDYDAIFVPSTNTKEGKPRTGDEMAFSLQSACSAAERRYAKITGQKTNKAGKSSNVYDKEREFKTQGGTNPQGVVGAYIYRAK